MNLISVFFSLQHFHRMSLQTIPFELMNLWRVVSSGILRRVALVRTDVSEELSSSFISVTRIGELGTTLAVTSNRRTASVVSSSPILVTLMKKALSSSETSVLTRATQRNILEDTILHSHRYENLKSYIMNLCLTVDTFLPRKTLDVASRSDCLNFQSSHTSLQ
jgi:hypothetical protein